MNRQHILEEIRRTAKGNRRRTVGSPEILFGDRYKVLRLARSLLGSLE